MRIAYEGHEHMPTQSRYRREVSDALVACGAVFLSDTGTDYDTGRLDDMRPVITCTREHPSYTPDVVAAAAALCPNRELRVLPVVPAGWKCVGEEAS